MLRMPAIVLLVLVPWTVLADTGLEEPIVLAPGEQVLTIVGTNDIHGALEAAPSAAGAKGRLGGWEWFAGYVAAIRAHTDRVYGARGHVVLLDGGDATQGTLLSNFSEGLSVIQAMNLVGYSAAIPGNHAYDFGPVGWEDDRVIPGVTDADPLGALRKAIRAASFPFLGTNVTTRDGKHLPELPAYTLVPLAPGHNLAIFGIEAPATAVLTIPENVEGLVFGGGAREVSALVEELQKSGRADVFVAVVHLGDSTSEQAMARWLESLPRRSTGEPLVDAAIASHTHVLNDSSAARIPYIQSMSSGTHFGAIQLILASEPKTGRLRVQRERTRQKAGIPIDPSVARFLGDPVKPDPRAARLVADARAAVDSISTRVLARATGPFPEEGGRTGDSVVGNLLADMMRAAAGTEIALINSGDIRAGLPAGDVTFERLFAIAPKNLRLVTVTRMPVATLVKGMELSARTCKRRGALQISGFTVDFERNCDGAVDGEDPHCRLLKLATDGGRILYERQGDQVKVDAGTVSVAISDFVLSGGAGYSPFREATPDPGGGQPLRKAVAEQLSRAGTIDPARFTRGRYRNHSGR